MEENCFPQTLHKLLIFLPFSNANYKNDLNPNIPDATHMDAIDFLKSIPTNSGYKGVLYDPPYSVRQVMECYKGYGINITQETTQAKWYRLLKDEINNKCYNNTAM